LRHNARFAQKPPLKPTHESLITGAAGFIGMHVAQRLLARGDEVVGIDNLNDYYDVGLKEARLARLAGLPGFRFAPRHRRHRWHGGAVRQEGFDGVINLAAQAGVRYSLPTRMPMCPVQPGRLREPARGCRHGGVKHFVYASSSSVYGGNTSMPFSEHDNVDHPVSLYAATKKSNELMAHTYSHLFGLPTTGLRFFTVYGPWGRPDMALFLFTKAILEGRPIDVFNHGKMQRDFTYIDDIAEGVVRVLDRPAAPDPAFVKDRPDPATSWAPYRVYNIGNHQPVELMAYIEALEVALGKSRGEELPAPAGRRRAGHLRRHR
jgi:UDP-glucuronate 4-epimerase